MASLLVSIAIARSKVSEFASDSRFITISAILSTNSISLIAAFQHSVSTFEIMRVFYCFQFEMGANQRSVVVTDLIHL